MRRLKTLAWLGLAARFDERAQGWALEAEYRESLGGNPDTALQEMNRLQSRAARCRKRAEQFHQQTAPAGAPF